jgi:hypothetical protein
MTRDVASLKLSVPVHAPADPIGHWVTRLAAKGVELFLAGMEGPAIRAWKRALKLEPGHEMVLRYLTIVGACPTTPAPRRPTTVVIEVQWNTAILDPHRAHEGSEELYEVLRDRALRAFRAKAWTLARVLLLQCAQRCPGDREIGLMLDVVHNRSRRPTHRRAA